MVTQASSTARIGVKGLDEVLAGGLARGHVFLLEGQARHRQDHHRAAVPAGRRRGWRAGPLHHALRDRSTSCVRAPPRMAGRSTESIEVFELLPPGEPAGRGPAAEPALFVRPGARRDDQADLRGGRAGEASTRRARQPVGDPPAGAKLAALSPPDPRAQALFCAARRHRAAARRPDGRSDRQDRPQRRAWRHPARRAGAGLRRRAPAPARLEVPRPKVPRRLPRLHDQDRRRQRLPAAGRGRAPHEVQARPAIDAASPSSTRCWAAASSAGRAR